jgi:hypothetical protein
MATIIETGYVIIDTKENRAEPTTFMPSRQRAWGEFCTRTNIAHWQKQGFRSVKAMIVTEDVKEKK